MLTVRPYTVAVTRKIPDCFDEALSQYAESSKVSLNLARQQHQTYVQKLREKLPAIELPPLEGHPDCCFVEDTVVAIGNTAVLTVPGHPSRRGETSSIEKILKEFGMKVIDMKELDELALCDGGDVLFTGRHVLVGVSDRTNQRGASILQASCSLPVKIVQSPVVGREVLHLKSIVTHLDEKTLVLPTGTVGDAMWKEIEALGLGYRVIRLPDIDACNLVVVNGLVIAQGAASNESLDILAEETRARKMEFSVISTSEIAKKDGALTCCSILLDI